MRLPNHFHSFLLILLLLVSWAKPAKADYRSEYRYYHSRYGPFNWGYNWQWEEGPGFSSYDWDWYSGVDGNRYNRYSYHRPYHNHSWRNHGWDSCNVYRSYDYDREILGLNMLGAHLIGAWLQTNPPQPPSHNTSNYDEPSRLHVYFNGVEQPRHSYEPSEEYETEESDDYNQDLYLGYGEDEEIDEISVQRGFCFAFLVALEREQEYLNYPDAPRVYRVDNLIPLDQVDDVGYDLHVVDAYGIDAYVICAGDYVRVQNEDGYYRITIRETSIYYMRIGLARAFATE